MPTTIVWFRQDLRLADHPALCDAAGRGAVVPVFLWCPEEEGDWPAGGARKWWLHQSLTALGEALDPLGSRLILREGPALDTLKQLAQETHADAVVWHRRYEPAAIARDKAVKRGLAEVGIDARSFNGHLLFEPWELATKQGKPYQVFTPFYNAMQQLPEPETPLDAPKRLEPPGKWPKSDPLDALDLMPTIRWYTGMANTWQPGEAGGRKQLKRFVEDPISDYLGERDTPSVQGTSRLSPYLHHGEVSVRQAYHAARKRTAGNAGASLKKNAHGYLRQLVWRDFGHHLLYHFPKTPDYPLREKYAEFPWIDMRKGRHTLEAWQRGQTGYPIIDAGMRELWQTGWMHNRVRMNVASFLVKHLLVDWREGARWFWDTLVDADLANNTLGWQWAGGCGADAAPYFRIFNPMLQGEKFDKQGAYVRRWCPELKDVPDKYLHKPWEAPPMTLRQAGVALGEDYPEPIVDHKDARERALDALSQVSG
ncbi:MAG: cryptochrome/photolyase family protein [Phycisphaerales bacterium JB063]